MSVYQNINGTLARMDASDLVQLAAVDTEGILGGTPGATTNGQTLVDQLAADDVQAQTDIGQIRTDLSNYHVYPSKNLLENKVLSYTQAVGTYTYSVSSDGKITVNGSDTATARLLSINNPYDITPYIGQDLVISGCVGGGDNTFRLYCNIRDSGGNLLINPNSKDGATPFTVPNNAAYAEVGILLYGGQTFTNKVFEPMICTAADYAADPSYEPHWVCMRDGKLDITDEQTLGSWNGLKVTATTQTVSGATFTVNSDGSINVNTPDKYTGGINSLLIATITDDTWLVGRYLTGCPAGGGFDSYRLFYRVSVGGGSMINAKSGYDTGDGFKIPEKLGAGEIAQIYIQIPENLTVTNKVFYPAIVPKMGFPFVPFAMTNRELTTAANRDSGVISTGYEYDRFGGICVINVNASVTLAANTWTIIHSALPYKANKTARAWLRTEADGGQRSIQTVIEDNGSGGSRFQIKCSEALNNAVIRGQIVYGVG